MTEQLRARKQPPLAESNLTYTGPLAVVSLRRASPKRAVRKRGFVIDEIVRLQEGS